MANPRRWLDDDAPPEIRRLLRAARREAPPRRAVDRAVLVVGSAGALGTATSVAAGAAVKATASSLGWAIAKWGAAAVFGLGVATTTTATVRHYTLKATPSLHVRAAKSDPEARVNAATPDPEARVNAAMLDTEARVNAAMLDTEARVNAAMLDTEARVNTATSDTEASAMVLAPTTSASAQSPETNDRAESDRARPPLEANEPPERAPLPAADPGAERSQGSRGRAALPEMARRRTAVSPRASNAVLERTVLASMSTDGTRPGGVQKAVGDAQLTHEMQLLDAARRAAQSGQAGNAMRWLEEYRRSCPMQRLLPEALLLGMQVAVRQGDRQSALAIAREISTRFPNSPHAATANAFVASRADPADPANQ